MTELWQRGRVILVWPEGHELHGLRVVMRRQPLGELLDGWVSEDEDDPRPWDELSKAERATRTKRNAASLAPLIVEWNLADEGGNPVPVSADGILSACDGEMIGAMREAYNEATTRVSPPLPKRSVDGSEPANGAPMPPESWDMPAQETSASAQPVDHPV